MLFSLGMSLFAISLLMVAVPVLLSRRPKPPRGLSRLGDFYAVVVVMMLASGFGLAIHELAVGELSLVEIASGVVAGGLWYGLWRAVRRYEGRAPALRLVDGGAPAPGSLGAPAMDVLQSRQAA